VLVAAMNPCPCGYLGDSRHPGKCAPMQIERYLARVSGPLLDRIDLHLEVPAVPFQELSAQADGTASATMRKQVAQARPAQRDRYEVEADRLNSRMSTRQLRKFCELDAEGRGLLQGGDGRAGTVGASARSHFPGGADSGGQGGQHGDPGGASGRGHRLPESGPQAAEALRREFRWEKCIKLVLAEQ
jgi:magnesium chelatase family protein